RDAAGRRPPQARQRVDQLRLAVAVDTGDADDLARPDLERDIAHRLELTVVEHAQTFDGEQRVAGGRRRLLDAQEHLATDHRPGEAGLGGAFAGDRLDRPPAPQDRDPVRDL